MCQGIRSGEHFDAGRKRLLLTFRAKPLPERLLGRIKLTQDEDSLQQRRQRKLRSTLRTRNPMISYASCV